MRIADVAAADYSWNTVLVRTRPTGRPGLRCLRSNLNVPCPHLVAVVLQEDVSLLQLPEPRDALELAVLDRRTQSEAVQLVLEHFHAVQPVLMPGPLTTIRLALNSPAGFIGRFDAARTS